MFFNNYSINNIQTFVSLLELLIFVTRPLSWGLMDVVEWTTREYNEWKGFIMCKHC